MSMIHACNIRYALREASTPYPVIDFLYGTAWYSVDAHGLNSKSAITPQIFRRCTPIFPSSKN